MKWEGHNNVSESSVVVTHGIGIGGSWGRRWVGVDVGIQSAHRQTPNSLMVMEYLDRLGSSHIVELYLSDFIR